MSSSALAASRWSHAKAPSEQERLRPTQIGRPVLFCATAVLQATHAQGRKSRHRWRSFRVDAPVCVECDDALATRHCWGCDDDYCARWRSPPARCLHTA